MVLATMVDCHVFIVSPGILVGVRSRSIRLGARCSPDDPRCRRRGSPSRTGVLAESRSRALISRDHLPIIPRPLLVAEPRLPATSRSRTHPRKEARMDLGARTDDSRSLDRSMSTEELTEAKSMDALVIQGGKQLSGRVEISGAKNAALPVMAATLLAPGVHTLRNVPLLADTRTMARVLEQLGARVEFRGHACKIDTSNVNSVEAPYDLVRTMRASIYVLGPLLARFGAARVSLPGGCAWGPRPVNLHLEGLDAMNAGLEIDHGYIVGKDVKLKGATIRHEVVSVGATAQLMMAATLAEGTTVIENPALEPDITELGEILIRCGARIEGIGSKSLTIHGVKSLSPIDATIIPDRIEAATFLAAAAITGGSITIERCDAGLIASAMQVIEER